MAKQLNLFSRLVGAYRLSRIYARAEEVWNKNTTIACLLLLGAAGFAVYSHWKPFLPGISVAVLGAMAAIMSLRPYMHVVEKALWCLIVSAVLLSEIHAIRIDRTANNKEQATLRDDQNKRFGEIVDGLKGSIKESRAQYGDTITRVDGVLETTREVSSLARRNLDSLTGGNSYAYLIPGNYGRSVRLAMSLRNDGKQPLTGIEVRIARVIAECDPKDQKCQITTDLGAMNPLQVGTLAAYGSGVIPGWIFASDDKGIPTHYRAWISAQNGTTREDIRFRPAKGGDGYAYQLNIYRTLYTDKNNIGHLVQAKFVDWTEPTPFPAKMPSELLKQP